MNTQAARQAPGPGSMPEGEISMDHKDFGDFPTDHEVEFQHPGNDRVSVKSLKN